MLDVLSRPVHVTLARTVAPIPMVTVDEAKTWLRIDDTDEDDLVEQLIRSEVDQVERDSGLSLLTQTWLVGFDSVPASQQFMLPVGPVQSVTSVKSYSTASAESTIATSVYRVDTSSLPARIVLKDGQSWPSGLRPQNAFLVEVVTGFGDDVTDVPASLVQATRLRLDAAFKRSGMDKAEQSAYEALIGHHALQVTW